MMKKYSLLAWIMMFMMMWWIVSAQAQRTTNLGDVVLRFCNDETITGGEKSIILDTEPEQLSDVCMLINNGGPTDTTILLNFVDGTITADEDQKKACEPEATKTNFGQYVTDYPTTVQIQAGETVKIWAKVLFPAGYAGTAYGCATFQIVDTATGSTATGETSSQMFTILTRRASFIDFNVKGEYIVDLQAQDAQTEWSFAAFNSNQVSVVDSLLVSRQNIVDLSSMTFIEKNPLLWHIGKPLTTRSVVVNSGNVWLDLNIQSQYRSWWWLVDIDQWSQIQKLVPKQRKTLEFDTNHLAWWVGGPVTVTHTITYKPIIIGSGWTIDSSLLAPKTMILSTSWLVTAWNGWGIIWWAFVIILWYIIYLIRRTFRKPHHHSRSKSFA
jgi:hypothetical protein